MRRSAGVIAALALFVTTLAASGAEAEQSGAASEKIEGKPAAIEKRVIGRSVKGRDIVAFHLGEPGARMPRRSC